MLVGDELAAGYLFFGFLARCIHSKEVGTPSSLVVALPKSRESLNALEWKTDMTPDQQFYHVPK